MSHDNHSSSLENLIHNADIIQARIDAAISNHDDDKSYDKLIDALSLEFDEIVTAILSYSITSFSELKQKLNFGKELILLDHKDPVVASEIFAKLVKDIEKLDEIYSP
ncbi:hypothetical protein N9W89_08515 [Hellea sp.]|nr:hypothetical protein [Hellea sp.]